MYDTLFFRKDSSMTSGKQGTGPYGEIRWLQQQISAWKYELGLITEQGMKRPIGKDKLIELIKLNRLKIKAIKRREEVGKSRKKRPRH